MEPYNYNFLPPVQDPFKSALQGYQSGLAIRDRQQAEIDAQKQAQAAQELAAAQSRARQNLMGKLRSGEMPNMADIMEYSTLLPPEQVKALNDQFNALPKEGQQQELGFGLRVVSALMSDPKVASDIIMRRAESYRNAGQEDKAAVMEGVAKQAQVNPSAAIASYAPVIASLPGGKEALDAFYSSQKAPYEVEKAKFGAMEAKSSAEKAAVVAKFAESDAAMDLQKKGWDIKKIANDIDIAKQNVRIAAMNAATSRMSAVQGNSLKAQENQIKLQELIDKRNETIRTKAAEIESSRASMDNMLNTADRILNTPKDVIDSAAGPISSRIPTMSSDTADFEALVETLGSQSFMAQIPSLKGMGALSNAEGEKLQAALQNFSLKQSPERLVQNVKEAQRIILKARKNIADKYGVPDTVPDTPAANASGSEIDALIKRYGGQ